MNWKELKGIGRDMNEVLSSDLPGVIEESHEKCRSKQTISRLRIEAGLFSDTGLEAHCYADLCDFNSF